MPKEDAEKLRKKLNGSILKGSKMRVEKARPDKRKKSEELIDEPTADSTEKRKRRRMSEDGVIAGVELPKQRKVKRGWTELGSGGKEKGRLGIVKAKKSKKTQGSTFTNDAECLFRTKLPASKSAFKVPKAKPKRGASREVVVHEFSNTTKHPSFLRSEKRDGKTGPVKEFIDGKGWIDDQGNLVEGSLAKSRQYAMHRPQDNDTRKQDDIEPSRDDDETSSSGSSEAEPEKIDAEMPTAASCSVLKGSGHGKEDGNSDTTRNIPPSGSIPSDQAANHAMDEVPSFASTGSNPQIHPLEALYKKPRPIPGTPKKPNLGIEIPFSFFDAEEEAVGTAEPLPQTPFTQRDLQFRNVRSAAPTPDTAAPNKTVFGDVWGQGDDIENEESEDQPDATPSAPLPTEGTQETESEFAKWFWQHRGETNRSWKKRRREAGKEKRQNENKKRGRSAV